MSDSQLQARTLRASVVIPAYNAQETLALCLGGLLEQTAAQHSFEIIVVDDGSTDDTAGLVARFCDYSLNATTPIVRLVQIAHGGAAAARNAGLAVAHGVYILFTDADCVPTPGWVAGMIAALDDAPDVVGFKGTYRTQQRHIIARFVQAEYRDRYRRLATAAKIDFIDTYSAAYRARVLREVGSFDPRYPGAIVEDAELSYRLSEKGLRLGFVAGAAGAVYHRHPASLRVYTRRKARIGFWRVAVYRRHPSKLRGDAHTPQVAKLQMVLVAGVALATVLGGVRPVRGLWRVAAVLFGLHLATTLPFARRAYIEDRAVGFVAPMLVTLRAASLAAGAIAGLVALPFMVAPTPEPTIQSAGILHSVEEMR